MRKILILFISLLFILSACGNDTSNVEMEKETEKKSEMTQTAALNYLEQISYRLVEANKEEDGSFEQKSSLEAALGRAESVYKEIEEEYEDLPILESFSEIETNVRLGAEQGLEGNYTYIDIHLEMVAEIIRETSEEYLNGELPPSIKYME